MRDNEVFLQEETIKEKARRILHSQNELRFPSERIEIKFSNGWLCSIKSRNNLRCFKSHGEAADADCAPIAACLSTLRPTIEMYNPKDVFNADEFGLNFKRAPTTTIGPALCKEGR